MWKQVGANKSNLVTKTTSLGMWVPIHDDEWDGNVPLGLDRPPTPGKDSKGEVVFKGGALPWLVGRYEVENEFRLGKYA
jgi:phosphatidylethanolamine N-methyltransferase